MPISENLEWKVLADAIPHIVWVSTADHQAEHFNRHGVEYTGLSADPPFDGRDWIGLIHPDDARVAVAEFASAHVEGRAFDSEYRLRRVDGEYRRHVVRSIPILDNDGGIVRWIGTATDVENQLETDRLLVEASTLLAALRAAAPIGLGLIGSDRNLIQMNAELAGVRGRSIADQLDTPVADALPSLWEQIEPAYAEVLASNRTVRNVQVVGMTAADPGQFHEWLASCYPVEIDDEMIGIGVVTLDITEQSQSAEFRTAVMGQIADGVYTEDALGQLVYMNRSASRMLGWTEDELRGKSVHDMIHFQDSTGARVEQRDCGLRAEGLNGRLTRAVGEVFTRKDGSVFPVAFSSMPLRLGDEVEGIAVVFRDVHGPGVPRNLIRLQIVDSHTMVTDAFQLLLHTQEGIDVVATSATSAAAIMDAARVRPDVVLVDFGLPDLDGVATARALMLAAPDVSIILMNEASDASTIEAAIEAGCAGVLDKARAWVDLVGAVRAAYHGHTVIPQEVLQRVLPELRDVRRRELLSYLTDREREVLMCISEGLSNQAVAERLGVTANTVRNHVQRVLYKLGAHSKLEAVVLAGLETRADD